MRPAGRRDALAPWILAFTFSMESLDSTSAIPSCPWRLDKNLHWFLGVSVDYRHALWPSRAPAVLRWQCSRQLRFLFKETTSQPRCGPGGAVRALRLAVTHVTRRLHSTSGARGRGPTRGRWHASLCRSIWLRRYNPPARCSTAAQRQDCIPFLSRAWQGAHAPVPGEGCRGGQSVWRTYGSWTGKEKSCSVRGS